MRFACFIFAVLLLPVIVFAQSSAPVVQARLIAENNAVVARQPARIGIDFNIPEGWHIYGRTVGDVGLATTIAWHLPDGFKAGGIAWPPEEGFIFQGIAGHGYTGHFLLPVTITAPQNLKIGADMPLAAHIEWLVCKDICRPESADLLLSLPIAASAQPGKDAALFNSEKPASEKIADFVLPDIHFWRALVLAFIGGLILNLMPCVFPILSMKALGLVKKSYYENRRHVVGGGMAYACGVIVSFWILAIILITLKNAGAAIGWGLQLQSPTFVALLAAVLLILGLMLSDVIRIKDSFANFGGNLAARPDYLGTFCTGALAVLVATPCTAPFMGGAMFYAFTQSWPVTLLVFTTLGLGLAAPYLILTLYPPALKILPRPGRWMLTLKKVLAIPMYLGALWLVWVFMQQTMIQSKAENTVPYSAVRLLELRTTHQPVFVDMTAAWCITCIFNEKNALARDEVQTLFRDHHITYMIGDWTNRNAAITDFLRQYGRVGVPLYVYFPAQGAPIILPQILTPQIILEEVAGD